MALAGSSRSSAARPITGVIHIPWLPRRMMLWQSGGKPIENDRNRIRQLELRRIKMIAHAVVIR
jgi:hypothetical protein